jgi:hypothetical protein
MYSATTPSLLEYNVAIGCHFCRRTLLTELGLCIYTTASNINLFSLSEGLSVALRIWVSRNEFSAS